MWIFFFCDECCFFKLFLWSEVLFFTCVFLGLCLWRNGILSGCLCLPSLRSCERLARWVRRWVLEFCSFAPKAPEGLCAGCGEVERPWDPGWRAPGVLQTRAALPQWRVCALRVSETVKFRNWGWSYYGKCSRILLDLKNSRPADDPGAGVGTAGDGVYSSDQHICRN